MKIPSTLSEYYNFDTDRFERDLNTKPESFWIKQGQTRALALFARAARTVSAYKDFLRKARVNPAKIKSYTDFLQLPLTDKNNYISQYSLAERSFHGRVQNQLVAMSSGTSGEPKFWPRGTEQETEAAVIHELIYKSIFQVDKLETFVVIGFPMGVYVSGVATLLPTWLVSQKYNMSMASPGNNKTEFLRLFKNLAPQFRQILLVGHPFFIKDVIETGIDQGINWRKHKVRVMFCSEGFNEVWRDYLLKKIGADNAANVINTYGSSEMLLMGHETEFSIRLRQVLDRDEKLREQVFADKALPNLFQYNPAMRFIEEVNGELVYTSHSGIPLIRFNLHDQGRVLSVPELLATPQLGKLKKTLKWNLPLVSLSGRSDQTMIFYAANIYPEHIHAALNNKKFLSRITGKFTLRKDYLKNLDQFLEIHIELKSRQRPSLALSKELEREIVRVLGEINMEYKFLQAHLDKNLIPRIKLWPYQHEKYFKPGLKPRYIQKNEKK